MTLPNDTPVPTYKVWPGAVVRAMHPARWGLCLTGVALSTLVGAVALALLGGDGVGLAPWWEQPEEQLRELGSRVFGQGSGRAVVRGTLLAMALAVVWSPIAAWIARAELLRRRDVGEPG